MKIIVAIFLSVLISLAAAELDVIPMPAKYTAGDGRLTVDQNFRVSLTGYSEPRLVRAIARMTDRLSRQTGMPLGPPAAAPSGDPILVINCKGASQKIQALGEDESYTLDIDSKQARMSASNPLGVLRGIETFLQLVQQDQQGFGIPAISIQDQPRFPWRGLMIDVSRHWLPMDVLKRNIDGMAAVKMNVLHVHLTDDQGFRVESKRFPELQQKGSDGKYFTQAQIRELQDYARDRGIRVVPEFDMPGHTTSWLVSHPELGSLPGPYKIERRWGIHDPTLDPTREASYQFLGAFIAEMAAMFDDQYFHIGGDEVNGKQWNASQPIQAFMKAQNIRNNHELERHFVRRVQAIVQKNGKRMMGWDEVLDPDLPKDIVIHSWRGQKSLAEAARQGYSGLLSAGYYLDLIQSSQSHYLVDPLDQSAASLTPEQKARILGGEACMWSEHVNPETVDSRIWPRNAAVAERLWSPQDVRDVASMHRRMFIASRWLDWIGLEHNANYRKMLHRLAGDDSIEPLRTLADVVEPVRGYTRGRGRNPTQQTPLNRLIDAARPESHAALQFRYMVASKDWKSAREMLETWRDNDAILRPTLQTHALLAETMPLSANLSQVATIGLEALGYVEKGARAPADWASSQKATLDAAKKPAAELLLMPVETIETLVKMAGEGAR